MANIRYLYLVGGFAICHVMSKLVHYSWVSNNMFLTEKLIQAVKNYPMLYDLSHIEYKNTKKKDKLWKKLGVELNESGDHLKKRWKNLRDTYAKHLKCTQAHAPNLKKNYKNWQWAKHMEHFRPYMPIPNVEELIQDTENGQDSLVKTEVEENFESYDMFSEVSVENIKANEGLDEPFSDSDSFKLSSSDIFEDPTSNSTIGKNKPGIRRNESFRERIAAMDPIELILLGYAKTIKTFSPERQAMTKLKFAQIMMEQECEHHKEQSLKL